MPKNYLITGLPRSGTTLLTSLLSENMEAVTFSEPKWLKEVRIKSSDCHEFIHQFAQKIFNLREDIRFGRPVFIKASRFNQGLPENYYHRNEKGEVITDKEETTVVLPKDYAEKPFIIKANAQFTACLNELVKSEDYKIICMIRNPVSTMMSWRSLDLPVSRGHMKVAKKYNREYKQFVSAELLLEKQAEIVNWFFKQYSSFREAIELIKYEELIENTEETLKRITMQENVNYSPLKSKNANKHYNQSESEQIKKIILKKVPSIKSYYHL